jgi:hypothetical protein
MKSMHLLLAAVLLTVATVWARAATQGIEQALVSIGGRLLPEGSKGKDKSLTEYYQLCLAG